MSKKKLIDLRAESTKREKALLVGVAASSRDRWREIERLDELAHLAESAGAEVFEKTIQIRERPDPSYYIGRGKAHEIKRIVEEYNLDLVIFDMDLSPSQIRNLEGIFKCKVVTRNELIMDIFAQHARTAEAKIQVELAQLKYRLSKLIGSGKWMSRLGAGIGTRGPGQTQLEIDRRHILQRIKSLENQLRRIERSKKLQRKRRRDIFKVALVGYTNTGKSSLMNMLTHADVLVEDKPFATLDATTRLLYLENLHRPVVLSDTVGFIEDIPPNLIASFHATLAVVEEADVLLHVIDTTSSRLDERIDIVEKTLEQLGYAEKPIIRVFNKVDLVIDESLIERMAERYDNSVFVSARTGHNIDRLKSVIQDKLMEMEARLQHN